MALMSGIKLGQYIPAGSLVHALDPRCKLLLTLASMTVIFMCSSLPGIAMWAILLPILIKLSRLPAGAVLRSAKPVLILIIFTSLLHLFLTPGREIFRLAFISITSEGVVMCLRMGLRLLFLVLYASLLTLTTSPSELSDGLESLLSPLKRIGVPAHEISMMMTIALRFIPTLFEETERLLDAQASRGADFESGGILKRAKAYIPVLIPLFVLVFQRADTLASAMEARCYRGGVGRVRMFPLVWKKSDTAAVALFVLFAAAALYVNRMVSL